ncbi:class I SAM-dependent methyltransferase [Lysinibacillus antri]|uniref:Class I SAM-dependent methyltransferase n=1 Tax=Lysinibacillus antri TaxID=2498145 RepID=A0A432LAC7_9BACI|nr:class I SAM-dependent methyltransferase [Lysinibacillus antri]RUL51092.1 class I SAM-dependent methyltransferase [Lysinibacillus antri]
MSFYQSLASYYDRIFLLNNMALTFVEKHFQQGESLLDIGAGTGNMALALAEKGFIVKASEPDEEMVDIIRTKVEAKAFPISIYSETMQQIEAIGGFFDGILCVGNTLPHLKNLLEIQEFLGGCFNKLHAGGRLILQLVNYDHVLANDNFTFPVIEKEDFTFTRHYTKQEDNILFTSKLKVEDVENENTIALYPVVSKQLQTILGNVGFKDVAIYGSFKGEPYSSDSKAMILVARKNH